MRFYPGTTWAHWWQDTPLAMIHASRTMLPRLQAQESILDATRGLIGSGRATPETMRAQLRNWERSAEGATKASEKKKQSAPSPYVLAQMGIAVVTVPARV